MTPANLKSLRERQGQWALARGIEIDAYGYCLRLEDNLFQPLSPDARAQFESGDGGEIGKPGSRGKLQALHSSAALACNVFDYWRTRDARPLARALRFPGEDCAILFEQKFPTGLRGNSPNLDVVLSAPGAALLAIESKFTEPYGGKKSTVPFKTAYFPDDACLWSAAGLPGCQQLAEDLQSRQLSFASLDVAQLLKHILGLSKSGRTWKLFYLWYRLSGTAGDLQAQEIEVFHSRLGADRDCFQSLSYQQLFERLSAEITVEHQVHLEYLRERYL